LSTYHHHLVLALLGHVGTTASHHTPHLHWLQAHILFTIIFVVFITA
jgi:hypothetical protein